MLSLNEARRVIRAAEVKAQQLGCAVNIAVVDEGGHVIAQVRMDGAWLAGVDAAVCKAYTARAFDLDTREMMDYAQSGRELAGIGQVADKRIMIAAGGVPLRLNGRICGAIGVSGCAASQDEAIAAAGANALPNGYTNGEYRHSEPGIRGYFPSQIGRLGNRSVMSQQQYGLSMQ